MRLLVWLAAFAVVMPGFGVGSGTATTGASTPGYRIVRPPIVVFYREESSGDLSFDVTVRLNRPLRRNRFQDLGRLFLGVAHSRHPEVYSDDPAPIFREGRPGGHCYAQLGLMMGVPRRLRHPKVGQAVTVELAVDGLAGVPRLVSAPAKLSRPHMGDARRLGC